MTQAPDEQLALARKIAADQTVRMDNSQRGYNTAADFLSGEVDDRSLAIQCALAAIRETTELAAKLAEDSMPVVQCMSVEPVISALTRQAEELRSFTHLKGNDHG